MQPSGLYNCHRYCNKLLKKKYTILTVVIASFLLVGGCRKDHSCGHSTCIDAKIDSFINVTCKTDNSWVKLYKFQGKYVYTFDMSNCGADIAIDVYDSDCHYLGFLGGIAGNTKINGVEFSTATYIRTVWSQ